jgi:endonuclease-3 related protein
VEKAIANLKAGGLLDADRLHTVRVRALAGAIRPAGYFNVKARRLKNYVAWYLNRYGADPRKMKRTPLPRLREELLRVNGVGPETADSILLYALGFPSFVVDAYTRRVFARHGLAPEEAGYEELKAFAEKALPRDVALYNEFHALVVAVGKRFCRPRARCEECPLRALLPAGK